MLGDTVNINNLCCNPSNSSEKKVGKTSKMLFFWTQFAQKRGHYGPRPRLKKKVSFPAKTAAAPLESQQNSVTPLWNEILKT